MAKFKDLVSSVSEYANRFRHPDLPHFEIGPAYDLSPEKGATAMECLRKWPDTWTNNNNPGIYAFLDHDLNVVYIGKSSMSSFLGARLSSYCGYDEEKRCKLKHTGWTVLPRYVWTVGVPSELAFEAPALEEFLITKLKPTDNVTGK